MKGSPSAETVTIIHRTFNYLLKSPLAYGAVSAEVIWIYVHLNPANEFQAFRLIDAERCYFFFGIFKTITKTTTITA